MNYRIVDSSGNVRHVSEFTQGIRNEAGEITHLVGYILDVTNHYLVVQEKKAAEAWEVNPLRLKEIQDAFL